VVDQPITQDVGTHAAQRLGQLLGMDAEHFRKKGLQRDAAIHGVAAMQARIRIIDPFQDASVEGVHDVPALCAAIDAHYGRHPRGWDTRLSSLADRFFAFRSTSLLSPLDGVSLPLRAELLGSRTRWMQWVVLGTDRLRILALEANTPIGIWYPERDIFLLLRPAAPRPEDFVRHMLHAVLERPTAFLNWLTRASDPRAKRAFIIGEARPAHFMAQTLGFMHRHMEERILPFLQAGHLMVILSDRRFIDPLRVFPELRDYAVLSVRLNDAPGLLRDLGLHCRLNDRRIANTDYGWTARLSGGTQADTAGSEFGAWISIDAERLRFDNQVEGFAACLRRLDAAAREAGKGLKVYWDGWTLAAGNTPSARDLEVIGRIEAIAAEIRAASGVSFTEERLYGRSAEEKIGLAAGCKIALTTYGTANILPTCALGIPTVTYHIAPMVTEAEISSGRYTDPHHTFVVPAEAVDAVEPILPEPHKQRFHVAVPALLDTLDRALAAPTGDSPTA
jgi:hypothetical protein